MALRGEGFAWVPDLGSLLKLREVQGASEEMARHRGCFRRKSNCGFGFVMYTGIRVLEF